MPDLILKSSAICLDIRPFSQTSQMVTWFTRDYGRVTTSIKGALRTKSAFLGQYGIGYTCELLFYSHDSNNVHYIRECLPLVIRENLRTAWRSSLAASYVCDLTMRTIQPNLANETLFDHLDHFLDVLESISTGILPLALLWYECQLLKDTGSAPDFTICKECPEAPIHSFSLEEGYFVCEHRPSRLDHPEVLPLHYEVVELLKRFMGSTLKEIVDEALTSTRVDALGRPEPYAGIYGLRRFLGVFLVIHLELPAGPRRTLLDLLLSE